MKSQPGAPLRPSPRSRIGNGTSNVARTLVCTFNRDSSEESPPSTPQRQARRSERPPELRKGSKTEDGNNNYIMDNLRRQLF